MALNGIDSLSLRPLLGYRHSVIQWNIHSQPFFHANLSSNSKFQWFFDSDVGLGGWPSRKRRKFSWWKEPGLAKKVPVCYTASVPSPRPGPPLLSTPWNIRLLVSPRNSSSDEYPVMLTFIHIHSLPWENEACLVTFPFLCLMVFIQHPRTASWLGLNNCRDVCIHISGTHVYTHIPLFFHFLENLQI